jgi:hypothetical protein
MTGRRTCAFALALVGVLLAGCSDDDGSDGSAGADDSATTSTTQPAASDPEAVRPFVEDLLAAWDEAMTPDLGEPPVGRR